MERTEIKRAGDRPASAMRPVKLTREVMKHALGSCLVEFGDTRVLCAATIEEGLPAWRRASRSGWVTAEYAMLPASTGRRTRRETGMRKGRSMEIERLIGRSLRTVTNLRALGEYTVTVDCDVIQADGGTRCASITGAWVALRDAVTGMLEKGDITEDPILAQVSAVSVGVSNGRPVLDLNYVEDSSSDTDMNVVMTSEGKFVEIQGTAEGAPFSEEELAALLALAKRGNAELARLQREALADPL